MIVECLYIIIILLFIHINLPTFIYNATQNKGLPTIDILDPKIAKTLNTGDILLFKNCNYCALNGNPLHDASERVIKGAFNAARFNLDGHFYTHVAIIICNNGVPFIYHINDCIFYDNLTQTHRKMHPSMCSLSYINKYSGMIHLYKYTRQRTNTLAPSRLQQELELVPFLVKNKDKHYPPMSDMICVNGLGLWKQNPNNWACTDLVENVWKELGIIDKCKQGATMDDVISVVKSRKEYASPIIVKNKCYNSNHYECST